MSVTDALLEKYLAEPDGTEKKKALESIIPETYWFLERSDPVTELLVRNTFGLKEVISIFAIDPTRGRFSAMVAYYSTPTGWAASLLDIQGKKVLKTLSSTTRFIFYEDSAEIHCGDSRKWVLIADKGVKKSAMVRAQSMVELRQILQTMSRPVLVSDLKLYQFDGEILDEDGGEEQQ